MASPSRSSTLFLLSFDERGWMALALLAMLALRLGALWLVPAELFVDEAQYWVWSRELAAGYYSKPPLLAWIIRGGTAVCGAETEFCIRVAMPVLHTLAALAVYLVGKQLFDRRTGAWAAVVYATVPGVTASSFVLTTDVPLMLFWALSLWAWLRLERQPSPIWAVALGLCLGAGLMSKYAMLYFALCAAGYLLAIRKAPDRPRWPHLALAAAVALLVFSPNIWWNFENGFVTARHTGGNINWQDLSFEFGSLAVFFISQFAVFGPILFAAYLIGAGNLVMRPGKRARLFLLWFSLPVVLLLCGQALLSRAYANWAAVAYVGGALLVTELLLNRWPRIWRDASLGLHVFLAVAFSAVILLIDRGAITVPNALNPLIRLEGPRDAAAMVVEALDRSQYAALLSDGRWVSAEMLYYLRDRPELQLTWRPDEVPRDHFELTRPYQDHPVEPVLLVTNAARPGAITEHFETVEPLGGGAVGQTGTQQVWLFRLSGFTGRP
ncbi:MAG: glycosyltransferase family 39 protein [Cucumibacter sp.]